MWLILKKELATILQFIVREQLILQIAAVTDWLMTWF